MKYDIPWLTDYFNFTETYWRGVPFEAPENVVRNEHRVPTIANKTPLSTEQLRRYVLRKALKKIGAYSRNAEELLVLICAHESKMCMYIHQLGGGPALGIFQEEPMTFHDTYNNFLKYQKNLLNTVNSLTITKKPEELMWNWQYATIMCRCQLLRFSEPLPSYKDVQGMAEYWKQYWNTSKGAGTVEQAIDDYHRYTEPKSLGI